MKRVLLIAFHYPPLSGSSGLQRTLQFSRHLPRYGWQPHVLTAREYVYQKTSPDQLKEIPVDVDVTRAIAFDAKLHFSLAGRYPSFLARPDRWQSWRFDAIRQGCKILAAQKFDAIWSTFPVATAHTIGLELSRRSNLPWLADLRDSMSEPGYPADPKTFRAVRALEGDIIRSATAVTFTAPGARQMYAERYPDVPADKYLLLGNGFDEAAFENLDSTHNVDNEGPTTLLHSGIVYPNERDPRPFFDAVQSLKKAGRADARRLKIILRATAHDDVFRSEIEARDIGDIIFLEPGVPYRDALQEMQNVDGLLVFQASNCNHQIPAKVYEYFRAGRPILALTDPQGDTAGLLRSNGHEHIARLDNADEIRDALEMALRDFRATPTANPDEAIRNYSRQAQTKQLAEMLERFT